MRAWSRSATSSTPPWRARPTRCVYTRAGPEICVASTKTVLAQIVALQVLALRLAQGRSSMPAADIAAAFDGLAAIPELVAATLKRADHVAEVAEGLHGARDFFFLGRHVGFPVALEGALKLKELSYLHAEGYPAGELKHGPIALIEPGTVVVAVDHRRRPARQGGEQRRRGEGARRERRGRSTSRTTRRPRRSATGRSACPTPTPCRARCSRSSPSSSSRTTSPDSAD